VPQQCDVFRLAEECGRTPDVLLQSAHPSKLR
jgi:hypothetical protein